MASRGRLIKKISAQALKVRAPNPYEHVRLIGCCNKMAKKGTPGSITVLDYWDHDNGSVTARTGSISHQDILNIIKGRPSVLWSHQEGSSSDNLVGMLVLFKVRAMAGTQGLEVAPNCPIRLICKDVRQYNKLISSVRYLLREKGDSKNQSGQQPSLQSAESLQQQRDVILGEIEQRKRDLANLNREVTSSRQTAREIEHTIEGLEVKEEAASRELSDLESDTKTKREELDELRRRLAEEERRAIDVRQLLEELAPAEDRATAIKSLEKRQQELQERECKLKASIQAGEEAIQANQATRSRLEGLLGEGRQRLWDDIQTVREVLEVGGRSSKAKPAPKGREFQDEAQFFSKRLEPALATWLPKASTEDAEFLHLALLGCRGVLVPGAIWTKAYAEALGASCCFSMTAVGATWIDPQKANDALAEAFQAARQNPHHIFLHHFRGIDRAPMQCWAGGLLDALAGLHDFEPGSDGVGWPQNLRITLSLDADDLSLPVPAGLLQGFGAVPREGLPGTPCVPLSLEEDAFLAARTWIDWTTAPRTADPVPPRDLGPWTRQGNREIQTLVDVATVLKHPPRLAELIRLEWPKNYASEGLQA